MTVKNLKMHNVYLTPTQITWLKEHKEFNLSGWVRKKLEIKIGEEE